MPVGKLGHQRRGSGGNRTTLKEAPGRHPEGSCGQAKSGLPPSKFLESSARKYIFEGGL